MLLESWEDLSKLEKLVSTGTASVLDGDTHSSEITALLEAPARGRLRDALVIV